MKEHIIITHPERVTETKRKIREAGPNKFHILADFDNTLTRAFVEGVKAWPIIAELRNKKYLTSDYAPQAHALYEKYAPLERDPALDPQQRREKMHEWWMTHFDLLVRSGFSKDIIKDVVEKSSLQFRVGFEHFISYLEKHNIPLVIMSAAPGDLLLEYLRHADLLRTHVHVIANLYEFDQQGKAVKIHEPIIHSLNKSEVVIQGFPVFESIRERTNILLMGDSLGDAGMAEGFPYDEIIKFGFLNQDREARLAEYTEHFDIVQTDDGSLDCINELLAELFE